MKANKIVFQFVTACTIYLALYLSLIFAIHITHHLPRVIDNFCFSFPQMMFPFKNMYWNDNPIFSTPFSLGFVSTVYLVLNGCLFACTVCWTKRTNWVIPLAFAFSLVAPVVFSLFLSMFHIVGLSVEPAMP